MARFQKFEHLKNEGGENQETIMVIRRRNKIALPAVTSEEHPELSGGPLNNLSKVKINFFPEDAEDAGVGEYETPIVSLKRNAKQISNRPETDDESTRVADYHDLFKNKPKILNLDDMIDDDMIDDENSDAEHNSIPTIEEIEKLKQRKIKLKSRAYRRDDIREKDYVSLLDNEDKSDLLETIKAQGRNEGDDDWAEAELPNDLEDERLVLSEREKCARDQGKRAMIEEALNGQQVDSTQEWESRLLSKGFGHDRTKSEEVPVLPQLCVMDDAEQGNQLDSMIAAVQRRKRQLALQLNTLIQQKRDLEEKKKSLISHFTSLDVS